MVGQVGLEPTTAISTRFTVWGDTNYTVLTHIILLATAPCTSASTPVNRVGAGTVSWKANPLKQYLSITYLATPMGHDPTTSAVTGRRSSQLNYGAIFSRFYTRTANSLTASSSPALPVVTLAYWYPRQDSNL